MVKVNLPDDDTRGDFCSGEIDSLLKITRQTMKEESRAWLFKNLLSRDLATPDVYNFAAKQGMLRDIIKNPDSLTMRRAMRIRLEDTKLSLRDNYIKRKKERRHLRQRLNDKQYRNAVSSIKNQVDKERKIIMKKYQEKINHYLQKQNIHESTQRKKTQQGTDPPHCMKDFDKLSIFKEPGSLKKPQNPLGPFICSKKIVLDKNERAILSRDPKYSVLEESSETDFLIELERGLAKNRYNQAEKIKRRKKKYNITCEEKAKEEKKDNIDVEKIKQAFHIREDLHPKEVKRLNSILTTYNENKMRKVYNPIEKIVDFTQRKATDYKHNKSVKLPKSLPCEEELDIEIRRQEMVKTYRKFVSRKKQQANERREKFLDRQKKGERDERKKVDRRPVGNGEILTNPIEDRLKVPIPASTEVNNDSQGKGKKVDACQRKKMRKNRKIENLPFKEINAMKSLKKKISAGELIISQTDKSSRFAVLTVDQYLKSGAIHTCKDERIDWKRIKYLQGQVNSHVWWISNIMGNAHQTDPDRMHKNVQPSTMEVPNMVLLFKDHKGWTEDTGKAVPSRPVVSGNRGINTHLSELMAEIMEPLSMEGPGVEISSTEEAICKVESVNEKIRNGLDMSEFNILQDIVKNKDDITHINENENGRYLSENCRVQTKKSNLTNDSLFQAKKVSEKGRKLEDPEGWTLEDEKEVIDILTDLGTNKELPKADRHVNIPLLRGGWRSRRVNFLKEKAGRHSGVFNDNIKDLCEAGMHWKLNERERLQTLNKGRISDEIMQDFNKTPIMVGGDVVALYPNMDVTSTAELSARAVRESGIRLKGVDYKRLAVYLYLVLGPLMMVSLGLGECVPKRLLKSTACSLASTSNRDMSNWSLEWENLSEVVKREMCAQMVKIGNLVTMESTCYSFGGELYRQRSGAGIGLRSSACLAKITMGFCDRDWAEVMESWSFKCMLFVRYIDDLRIYCYPIKKGWWWASGGWKYDPSIPDSRDDEERTREEICKSLNSVMDFLQFTVETQKDFVNNMLPTLDIQIRVESNGLLTYKHFTKPTNNNILLQKGTALSDETVFSSLRQELIRRMKNTSMDIDLDTRIEIIEEFIQILVNGGHKYSYIKAIVLQALTKYMYMVERSLKNIEDRDYMPLYRENEYRQQERLMFKYIESMVWYSDTQYKDPFRNTWKRKIKRRFKTIAKTGDTWAHPRPAGNGGHSSSTPVQGRSRVASNGHCARQRPSNSETTTTFFVPPSSNGVLAKMIQQVDMKYAEESGWNMKILEKSGKPLINYFMKTFPMILGCPRGEKCVVCDGNAKTCSPKGVVYLAKCSQCEDSTETDKKAWRYVGETSRPIRDRALEHCQNLEKWRKDSFWLSHWMLEHSTQVTPPKFEFEVLECFKDALRRQIAEAVHIWTKGDLNRKNEFNANEICRMQPLVTSEDQEILIKRETLEKVEFERKFTDFVQVMSSINKQATAQPAPNTALDVRTFYSGDTSKI